MPINLLADDIQRTPRNLLSDEPKENLISDQKKIQPESSQNEIIKSLADALKNFSGFTRGAGESVVNFPAQLANLVLPNSMEFNLLKSYPQNNAYKAGEFAGDFLTFGGGAKTAEKALEMASKVPELSNIINKINKSPMAKRAIGSGIFGAAKADEDESALTQAGLGAAISAGIDTALKIPKALKSLSPTRIFRGKLTPEELKENLRVTEGTNTFLGDVIGSPVLKRQTENFLTKIPFSGAEDALANIGSQVKSKGEEIFKNLKTGKAPETVGEQIKNSLKDVYESVKKQKKEKWDEVDNLAEKYNINPLRENLSNTAIDILTEMSKSPELSRKYPDAVLKDLKEISAYKKGNNLKLSNMYKSTLGEDVSKYFKSGDEYISSKYIQLKEALNKDILKLVDSHPELKKAYLAANKFHAEKYAPFKNELIEKFLDKGGNPDKIIQTFLPNSSYDQPYLAKMLQDKLKGTPAEKLMGYGYLERAVKDKELDVEKMVKFFNDLGDEQKRIIFDKKTLGTLEDYSKLVGMNKKALKNMENPNTGKAALEYVPWVLAQQAVSAGSGYLVNGLPGMLAGVALGVLPNVSARYATKALTSPEYRNKFIKKMIENEKKSESKNINSSLINAIAQALAAQ